MMPTKIFNAETGEDERVFTEVAELERGEAFGELALLREQPRTATVVCKKDSMFLKLDKKSYNRILGGFDKDRLGRI